MRAKFFLLALLIPALLTSCLPLRALDTRLTFRADENWEVRVELAFEPGQAQLAAAQIEQALNEYVSRRRAEGIEAKWERQQPNAEGNIPYVLTTRGQGLDKLNAALFDNRAMLYTDKGSGYIIFQYAPDTLQLTGVRQTFTLVGEHVVSTNGLQTGNGVVVWKNPTQPMEAILTPLPRYPWLPYALIGAGGILILIAVVGVVNNLRYRRALVPPTTEPVQEAMSGEPTQPSTEYLVPTESVAPIAPPPAPMAQRYCHNCGNALASEAHFCPTCGAPRRA